MGLRRTTTPAAEPVSLAEAKLHLRVDAGDEDSMIGDLIVTARMTAEERLRRALMSSGWALTLDAFPGKIELPMPPLVTVASIAYVDSAGASQQLPSAAYFVDPTSEPGRVVPLNAWPAVAPRPSAITISYTAGWATAADVPRPIKQWMLLAVGEMYANREALPDGFADRLLDPYRIWR